MLDASMMVHGSWPRGASPALGPRDATPGPGPGPPLPPALGGVGRPWPGAMTYSYAPSTINNASSIKLLGYWDIKLLYARIKHQASSFSAIKLLTMEH